MKSIKKVCFEQRHSTQESFDALLLKLQLQLKPLKQINFVLKDVFSVIKLLPVTAKSPLHPLQCWLIEEHILLKSSMTFVLASNIAMEDGGISSGNFFQKARCLKSAVRECRYFQMNWMEFIFHRPKPNRGANTLKRK